MSANKRYRGFTPSAPTMTVEECLFGLDQQQQQQQQSEPSKSQQEEGTDNVGQEKEDEEEEAAQQQQQQQQHGRRRCYPNKDHVIDIVQLRKLAAQGMDGASEEGGGEEEVAGTGAGTGHRALTWRVLLGYLPRDTNKWKEALDHQRGLYTSLCHELFYFQNEQDIDGEQLQRHNHNVSQSEIRKQQQLSDELEEATEPDDEEPELILDSNDNNNNNDNGGENKDGATTTASKRYSVDYNKFYNHSKNKHKNKNNRNSDIDFNDLNLGTLTKRQKEVLERLSKSLAINKLVIKNEEWNNFMENSSLLDEIRKDVIRTHPDLYFFLEPSNNLGQKRYAAIERILFIWAKLNKGVRYVQGMNEIVGTLYFVLANDFHSEWASYAEADTYVIFNILMSDMRDVFVPDMDDADTGIQGRISNMQELLGIHDPEVRYHLDDCGIDASFYAVRWLTTLLSREFLLPDTIRLWDSMFASTHKENFLRYVCVTMVILIRHDLIVGDFSTCLRLLQAYPPNNMDQLLESSRALWIYESQIMAACHRGGVTLQQALQAISPPPSIIMAFGLRGGMMLNPGDSSSILPTPKQVAKKVAQNVLSRVVSNSSTSSDNNNNNNNRNSTSSLSSSVTSTTSAAAPKEATTETAPAIENNDATNNNSDNVGENKGFLRGARRLWNGWGSKTQQPQEQQQQEQEQQVPQQQAEEEEQEKQEEHPNQAIRSSPRSRFWSDGASGGVANNNNKNRNNNQYAVLKKSPSDEDDKKWTEQYAALKKSYEDDVLPFNANLMVSANTAARTPGSPDVVLSTPTKNRNRNET